MKLVSVREDPALCSDAIRYFQEKWAAPESLLVYEDCIKNCCNAPAPLPQWYLLYTDDGKIAGGAGLITNDFISRMDLYPWLCALYVEPPYRGNGHAGLLLKRAAQDARAAGFGALYLCTDHTQFYERYGLHYIGDGYHPWGHRSRIYEMQL